MKKVLYGTTALVAAGVLGAGSAAADGISLGLGGYMNTYFSVAGIDEASSTTADYNSTGLFSDGEVHFKGEYKHDNGITFGVNVQLEAFGEANNGGDEVDERYIEVKGDFGRVVAGSENSAAYIMHYAAPTVGLPINSGWVTVFIPAPAGIGGLFRSPGGSTYMDFGNDANVITHYTPRFSGLHLGATHAPSVVANGDGKNFPVEADTETEYSNGMAVGMNFVEDFNGFGVAISGGYRRATVDDARDALGAEDYQAISAGVNLSYAGFTIGGSYANEMDGKANAGNTIQSKCYSWDAGVSYAAGPWSVGATYLHGQTEGLLSDPDEDELDAVEVGVSYQVGPGISARGGVMWAEWENEEGEDQSGIVGAVGLSFSF